MLNKKQQKQRRSNEYTWLYMASSTTYACTLTRFDIPSSNHCQGSWQWRVQLLSLEQIFFRLCILAEGPNSNSHVILGVQPMELPPNWLNLKPPCAMLVAKCLCSFSLKLLAVATTQSTRAMAFLSDYQGRGFQQLGWRDCIPSNLFTDFLGYPIVTRTQLQVIFDMRSKCSNHQLDHWKIVEEHVPSGPRTHRWS